MLKRTPPFPPCERLSRRLTNAFLCAGLGVASLWLPRPTAAQTAVNVTIQADTPRGTVQPEAFGLNVAIWDSLLTTRADIPPLMQQAGVTIMRFPGGSSSDLYHWQTNTGSQGQYVDPNNTFDRFMSVVKSANAQAMITVNYGTDTTGNGPGDPNEAAAWVDYSNNVKKYGVEFWEVGNEIYGNGFYGSSWEPDNHGDHSPTAYGQNVVKYVSAMKAKDPTIKVGAVLCSPGQWPDTQSPSWNEGVLAQCGGVIDFVIVHHYPQNPFQESDAGLLAAPGPLITYQVPKLRALISKYCGANAANVKVCITEANSVSSLPGKQTLSLVNALFLADDYATWLENGVANVDWWDLHNGWETDGNLSASLYGDYNYGDYSILGTFQSQEPGANFPFPTYHAFEMLTHLAKPGDQFVNATSNQSLLGVHAARQANGNLAVLLINKDPNQWFNANVSLSGYTPLAVSTDYFYGKSSATGGLTAATSSASTGFIRTVPPYSLTTVVMQPNGSSPTPTPTPPPTPTPTPTPIPTPPPTPTPTPGNGYTVAYSVTSQWDGAFNGNVTITNTSGAAINGWTLGWTFSGNQKIVNVWGGNPAQSGQKVTVTNAPYDGTIPAGGSVSFGFQATFSGSNINPTSFTLNGTGGSTPTPTPTPVPTPTPTPTPTPAPTPTPTGSAQVIYTVGNQWQDGFMANVTIQNNGPAVNSWKLTWVYLGNQQVTGLWNGIVTQSGKTVTVTNASYNGSIPTGGTVTLGFQASYSGTNSAPTNFTFNGVAVTPTTVK